MGAHEERLSPRPRAIGILQAFWTPAAGEGSRNVYCGRTLVSRSNKCSRGRMSGRRHVGAGACLSLVPTVSDITNTNLTPCARLPLHHTGSCRRCCLGRRTRRLWIKTRIMTSPRALRAVTVELRRIRTSV